MLVGGCGLALAIGLAWQLRLWETLASEFDRSGSLSKIIDVGFVSALVFATGVGLLLGVAAVQRVVKARRAKKSAGPEFTSLVAIGLALSMVGAFALYLLESDVWTKTTAVFHVERTLGLASLTSPLPAITALLGVGYGWAFWGLRSLHHHVVDMNRAEPIFALFGGKGSQLSRDLMLGAQSTIHSMGALLLLPAVAVPAAMLLGVPRTHTVDGSDLGWVISLGSLLGLVAIGIELGQAAWLGRRINHALVYLRWHALGPTIENLGGGPADLRMSLDPGQGNTYRVLSNKLMELRRTIKSIERELANASDSESQIPDKDERKVLVQPVPTQPWEKALGRRVEIRSGDLHMLSDNLEKAEFTIDRPNSLLRTTTWTNALKVAGELVAPMENRFWRIQRPVPAYTLLGRFLKDAEGFVALVTAILVRTMVVRVVRGLSIAAMLGGTLLLGHLFYTFPGRRFWLLLDFIALTLIAVVSVPQLLMLERDHLLSRLWSTTPGRVSFSSALIWRAMASAALPLLTLLAVSFPEVGGSLLTWIEPMRQLMPVP
jgi:hypothetical protein